MLFHSYYINLDHRTDRKESIITELGKMPGHRITRIPAHYTPELGTLGCCRSHISALTDIIESDTADESMHAIFEDDFEFSFQPHVLQQILEQVSVLMTNDESMHVFCLGVNVLDSVKVREICIGDVPFELHRIRRSQAHSGYIVKKIFAPILLQNYSESESMITQCNFSNHPYCFDVYVQHLQDAWGWYTFLPKIGRQAPGYSDIEKSVVDHRC